MGYINSTSAGGGTMMIEGIRRSLKHLARRAPPALRSRSLTDGYIGNEWTSSAKSMTCGTTAASSASASLLANRFLLDGIAKMGARLRRVSQPQRRREPGDGGVLRAHQPSRLTDLQIDWGNMQVADVYPQKLPDLFVGGR